MTTPHKHAEVLRAIADGKEVECKSLNCSKWENPASYNLYRNPITDDTWYWRVKPEKKPDVVKEVTISEHVIVWDGLKPNLRLTFDGETGDLVKAEVIK